MKPPLMRWRRSSLSYSPRSNKTMMRARNSLTCLKYWVLIPRNPDLAKEAHLGIVLRVTPLR